MTELIWEGKYKDGKKTAPIRIDLPFQTIETVNESAADRQRRLGSLFQEKQNTEWRNRLIWGDKKYVLPSLLPEFAGKVNLIYIDPPFNVGSDFSFTATIPDHPDTEEDETTQFVKEPSIIEQKAYRDTWGRGLDSYLQWFYETVVLLHELLAEDGSIYVHLDWHVGHYAKTVLDEIFGPSSFRNEIIREKSNPKNYTRFGFGNVHDTILFYSKGDALIWNKPFADRDQEKIEKDFPLIDENGRRYKTAPLHAPGIRYGETGTAWRGLSPPSGNHWRYIQKTLNELDKQGHIQWSSTGNPREKIYADESAGLFIQDIWSGFKDTGQDIYATQKPETLLDRIINASSNENDLVLDCFCGSGTTAAVAEKLNRRWITCDLGRFAIHTTRKRLLGIENVRPFVVQNLGKYERQQWVKAEFDDPEDRLHQEKSYRRFIVELYAARPIDGYTWLHGAKAGRMIHVGSVEAPVTVEDIKATIVEFWKLVGKEKGIQTNGVDFLGWDFAFDVNQTAQQFAASNNVDVKFKKIPREVLEKKAVEQGDIRFYELAALKTKVKHTKKTVTVTLENFIMPPDDLPEDVKGKITHWSQWIDYWAVDWNFREDTFHNEWQSYRTKKDTTIELTAKNDYEKAGKYVIVVKVIDILGNDTTKAMEIEIK